MQPHTHKPSSQRQLAIASAIQQAVSNLFIKQDIYHPALEDVMLTFPFVKVTADLKIATIYIDCLNKSETSAVLKILQDLGPQVRKMLANTLQLRYAPEIKFRIDEFTAKQSKLLKILDAAD